MEKKLYKSDKDKKLCGVCGGVAEYLAVDPTIVRIVWIICCFMGFGLLAYLICALVMPNPVEANDITAESKVELKEELTEETDEKTE